MKTSKIIKYRLFFYKIKISLILRNKIYFESKSSHHLYKLKMKLKLIKFANKMKSIAAESKNTSFEWYKKYYMHKDKVWREKKLKSTAQVFLVAFFFLVLLFLLVENIHDHRISKYFSPRSSFFIGFANGYSN